MVSFIGAESNGLILFARRSYVFVGGAFDVEYLGLSGEMVMGECENDCKYLCIGCDKYFCEIKDEFNCPHDEEMPEAVCTNAGERFCHGDCLDVYYD